MTGNGAAGCPARPDTSRHHASASPAVRVRTPGAARPVRSGEGNRPPVTFSPSTPHHAAGIRTDPAPSEPVAHGTSPAATATAAPAEDPPGVRSARHGLTVRPPAPSPQVCHGVPGPGTDVAPTATAPAASSGSAARRPCRPLTATGTPASGGRSPAAIRASTSAARRSASSPHTSRNAHSSGSARAIRASASATTSTARRAPARTAAAISRAPSPLTAGRR
ncbi:hypothetical protein RKD47_002609 [Streptomyces albogriseolus]